ncbi:hypothetical protein [Arsenicibacter rosenii]|uniref:hypothetical protein n=1 Tax=Arsenicibacter rosenii TaxID=1750698 RepID=UPI000AD9C658|nr:hypothetical protein [Arsenicibacter rosenii]
MRQLVIYMLLVAVLLPVISPWGTIAYYQLNKDYIARVLCENRDKPQLHCDGKCYLAKRLKEQQDKQDKETAERVQKLPVVQLFSDALTTFVFQVPHLSHIPSPPAGYAGACLAGYPGEPLQPPQAS